MILHIGLSPITAVGLSAAILHIGLSHMTEAGRGVRSILQTPPESSHLMALSVPSCRYRRAALYDWLPASSVAHISAVT